jgi:UrcA family protein
MEDTLMKTLAKMLGHSLVAAGLSAALVAPAFAGSPFAESPRNTAEVRYADLDLGTAAGQRMLDARIEGAIRKVCRSVNINTGTRIVDQTTQECKTRARADAKQQVAALMSSDAQRGG